MRHNDILSQNKLNKRMIIACKILLQVKSCNEMKLLKRKKYYLKYIIAMLMVVVNNENMGVLQMND